MSNEQFLKIPRLSDRALVAGLQRIDSKHSQGPLRADLIGFAHITIDPSNLSQEAESLLAEDSYLVKSIGFTLPGLNVGYYRGGYPRGDARPSPVYDELRVVQRQNDTAPDLDRALAMALVLKTFHPFESLDRESDASELHAVNESTLLRLQQLNEDLIRKGVEYRQLVDKDIREKAAELDEEYEGKAAKLKEAAEEHEQAIRAQRAELDAKLKAIDDSNNTHARRKIRESMLDDVKQRIEAFGVSKATESKRGPVQAGIAFLAATLAAMLFFALFELQRSDSVLEAAFKASLVSAPSGTASAPAATGGGSILSIKEDMTAQRWLLWIRISLLSLGLVATLLYYVRWQGKWAQHHADAEFNLQQFHLDINRANWVVESCLEWRKNTASAIPKELLESITRGLFSSTDSRQEQVLHPADELASALLGSASKLKLQTAGGEVEIDKPGKIPKSSARG